jgi:chemotaxis signal transduction protein
MKTDVLPICLGNRWLLVRAKIVIEFLSRVGWLSVPGSSSLLPGVMTWRGRAIPMLDLGRALHLGSIAPTNECARVMVVSHATGIVAIPVGGAREVKTLFDEDIRPPHVSTTPYTSGEVQGPEVVWPLIELDQLLMDVGNSGA